MAHLRLYQLLRVLVTALVLGLLVAAIYALWIRYQVEPLTRDGKVRADIVPVAADVGGLVTEVRARDNQQVRKGDVLMVIDRPRYELAVRQAEASLGNQRAALDEAVKEDRRNRALTEVVPQETVEQGEAKVAELKSAVAQGEAAVDLARFNLERTLVRAPVDGTVTNVTLQPGVYLPPGKPALALVYDHSLRVEGYFEETKLQAVHVGDPAIIRLMGVGEELHGRVESIEAGVEDRERAGGDAQLANVNPTFTWVRLAQRIPVRVAITAVPPHVRLVPGQTATVEVQPRPGEPQPRRALPW
jgi:RND family efflux transporter MFP subunit